MQQTEVTLAEQSTQTSTDYSTFFHSGLRAISSHVRSMSTPLIIDPSQTSHPPSLRSSLRSRFWKHSSEPEAQISVSPTQESNSPAPVESIFGFKNVWTIKNVPLRLGLPRFPGFDKTTSSPSRLVSLEPLAPSAVPTSSSCIDLSEASSSSSNNLDFRKDELFLPISSVSRPCLSPLSGRPLSIQTMPLPSCRSFFFSPIDQGEKFDDSWAHGLDMDSPSEFHYGRLDVLPQSAVDTEVTHWDGVGGENDDWRQFHADWLQSEAEMPFSPTIPDSP